MKRNVSGGVGGCGGLLAPAKFWCGDDGTRGTLILPPDPPDPPAGCGIDKNSPGLQGALELGGGWRIGDAILGIRQIRQEVAIGVTRVSRGRVVFDFFGLGARRT